MPKRISRSSKDSTSELYLNLDSRPRKVEQACKFELQKLEEDDSLTSSEKAEQRAKIILNAPVSIARKRALTKKYITSRRKRRGSTTQIEHKPKTKGWKDFKSRLSDFSKYFVVWRKSVKKVEGKFGSAVASYFVFLRWLFFLNLFISVLLIIFVVVPEIFVNHESIRQYYDVTEDSCATEYLMSIDGACKNNGSITDCVENFLVGEGWIEETILFYGSYAPSFSDVNMTTLENLPGLILGYNRPVAYILTTVIYLALCLVVLIQYATSLFQKNVVLQKDKNPLKYTTLLFTGWDFNIVKMKTAQYRRHNMKINLQVELEAERGEIIRHRQHFLRKFSINGIRLFIHGVVTFCNICAYYLIYYTTQLNIRSDIGISQVQAVLDWGLEWLSPVTLTVLNSLLHNIFSNIVQYEDYSPTFEVFMTLLRISFLKLASLLVLLFSLYQNITCVEGNNQNTCGSCAIDENNVIRCWENEVGQEFYKLTIVDLFFTMFTVFSWEYPRKYISRKYKWARPLGNIEFELTTQVLNLVNSQAISWIGGFFCPFLPLITTIKFFILFYLRKWSLLHNMSPSSREARASKSGFFFVVMLLVTFLLCLIPVAYAIVTFETSVGCGPFRGLSSAWFKIYDTIRESDNAWILTIYGFLGTAPVIIGVLALLLLALYYQYNQSLASADLINHLEAQLKLEKKAKYAIRKKMRDMKRMKTVMRHEVGRTL